MVRLMDKSEESIVRSIVLSETEDPLANYFIDFYFDSMECYVYEENSNILAVAFRTVIDITNIGGAAYICGATTKIEYRRQGYMTKLLNGLDEINVSDKLVCMVLIPRTEDLFNFYYDMGFKTVSHINETIYTYREGNSLPFHYEVKSNVDTQVVLLSSKETDLIIELYKEAFLDKCHSIRNKISFRKFVDTYVANNFAVYGLYVKGKLTGYAFYNPITNTVEEIIAQNDSFSAFLNTIMKIESQKQTKVLSFQNELEKNHASMKLYKDIEIQEYYVNLLGN